jgi:hypothetical protein
MLTGTVPRPGARAAGGPIDAELAAIVDTLLVVDPDRREADAIALGDELAAVAERLRERRLNA